MSWAQLSGSQMSGPKCPWAQLSDTRVAKAYDLRIVQGFQAGRQAIGHGRL